jgi:hypothetical protein
MMPAAGGILVDASGERGDDIAHARCRRTEVMYKAHRGWNVLAALLVLVPAVVVPIAAWQLVQRPAPMQSAVAPREATPFGLCSHTACVNPTIVSNAS